uniref:hypothetical protein n=1 Tax=Halomonas sp. TaxID=1486246 RepID=UPI00262676F0|nr:hypothetical protein [Halomonas sp.]
MSLRANRVELAKVEVTLGTQVGALDAIVSISGAEASERHLVAFAVSNGSLYRR